MKPALTAIVFLLAASVYADERSECMRLAPRYNAECEVTLFDGSRVDLLNDEYAIEVDWARKWPEAVGQALWYSILTHKRPAVLLLTRDRRADLRFLLRATAVCERSGIRLFVEVADDKHANILDYGNPNGDGASLSRTMKSAAERMRGLPWWSCSRRGSSLFLSPNGNAISTDEYSASCGSGGTERRND